MIGPSPETGPVATGLGSAALDAYLAAAMAASDEHPYLSLGHHGRGPLSAVYVDRQLCTPGANNRHPTAVPLVFGNWLSLEQALDAHSNLVVYAGAGLGKSTMLAHVLKQSIGDFQGDSRQGYLGVRVSARGLARREGDFVDALTAQVNDELGRRLMSKIRRGLFDAPARRDSKWLVLVDGLDEIVSAFQREQVVRALQTHAKTNRETFRFIATSRPLETLGRFDPSDWGEYELPRFGKTEVESFSRRWFTGSMTQSAAFLAEIERQRLTELAEVPLLLTLLAVVFQSSGSSALPEPRAALLSRFFEVLLDDEESARRTREQFVSQWVDRFGVNGEAWFGMLFDARRELLASLAVIELSNSAHASIDEALRFVKNWLPVERHEGDGWLREQLATIIDRSGIAAVSHGEVLFPHRSFAEFLAATSLVKQFKPDDLGMMDFVRAAVTESSGEVMLFALEMWSGASLDCSEVLRLLRQRDTKGVLTAAAAISGGAIVSAEEHNSNVDALIAIARRTSLNDILLQNRALELLGGCEGSDRAVAGLAAMVGDSKLPDDRRGVAANQLGNLGRADLLLPWLEESDAPAYVLAFAGLALVRLGHQADVVRHLEPYVCDESRPSGVRWEVNKALVEAGSCLGLAFIAVDATAHEGVRQVAQLALAIGDRRKGLVALSISELIPREMRQAALELLQKLG